MTQWCYWLLRFIAVQKLLAGAVNGKNGDGATARALWWLQWRKMAVVVLRLEFRVEEKGKELAGFTVAVRFTGAGAPRRSNGEEERRVNMEQHGYGGEAMVLGCVGGGDEEKGLIGALAA
ncbi:hypothetical protein K7X08_026348 [Anisodus acutangulus]|uniref:Uncharacterized protein n=1 Tax=Anisodus acutangulus TaxID=402998 RepID=A0A9Q1LQ94_9SOLA|nr:hypothetical protein K7X08_026348 [Anisodus acutangulus]